MSAYYSAVFDGVALSAGVAKTVIILKGAATTPIDILEVGIFGQDTVSSDTPIKCELRNDASTGGTTTAQTSVLLRPGQPASNGTVGINASVEPTYGSGAAAELWRVHPQLGMIVQSLYGQEDGLTASASAFWALRLTAVQGQTVSGYVKWRE